MTRWDLSKRGRTSTQDRLYMNYIWRERETKGVVRRRNGKSEGIQTILAKKYLLWKLREDAIKMRKQKGDERKAKKREKVRIWMDCMEWAGEVEAEEARIRRSFCRWCTSTDLSSARLAHELNLNSSTTRLINWWEGSQQISSTQKMILLGKARQFDST